MPLSYTVSSVVIGHTRPPDHPPSSAGWGWGGCIAKEVPLLPTAVPAGIYIFLSSSLLSPPLPSFSLPFPPLPSFPFLFPPLPSPSLPFSLTPPLLLPFSLFLSFSPPPSLSFSLPPVLSIFYNGKIFILSFPNVLISPELTSPTLALG